jgi:hypothetical protein
MLFYLSFNELSPQQKHAGAIMGDRSLIAQQIEDHQETMEKATIVVENFYKTRILPYMGNLKTFFLYLLSHSLFMDSFILFFHLCNQEL